MLVRVWSVCVLARGGGGTEPDRVVWSGRDLISSVGSPLSLTINSAACCLTSDRAFVVVHAVQLLSRRVVRWHRVLHSQPTVYTTQ